MISFQPTDEESDIRKTVERFAAEAIRPDMRDFEARGGVPDELRRRYHEMGLGTLTLPEDAGGLGMGLVTRALVEEELAHGDPGAALDLDGPGFAALFLAELGDEAQRREHLEPFAAPDAHGRLAALALLEPRPLADWWDLETTARADGDGWVLDGRKSFVVHGASAATLVVLATLDREAGWDGLAAFVLPGDAAGITASGPVLTCGLNTVPIVDLTLEGVRVGAGGRLLGGDDFTAAFHRALSRCRVVNAARTVGLGRAAVEYAVDYAQERTAFGKPIAEHQGLGWMLADVATELEAARCMVWKAAVEADRGAASAERSSLQAAVQANEMALKCTIDGVQVLGGAGFIRDYPEEKWYRDARTLASMLGTDPMSNARATALALTRDGAEPIASLA